MSQEHLSDRIKSMTESATIAMSQLSREMKAQGIDVISLSIGEPDFNTPDEVKQAAKDAIDQNFSKYPPIAGYEDLKQAICDKFKTENNIDYSPSQIIVSTGAKQSIANVILALVNEGDEVLLPAPYWVSYIELIKLAGGIPVEIPSSVENDYKVSAQDIAKAITPKSKLIIYSSPCNPSGSVFTAQELREIADVVLQKEDLYILADEIYEYINFTNDSVSIASFPDVYDRVATVNGVAKGFAMTGWRLGYMGGPAWLVKACNKIQGQITSGTNTIAQKATIEALKMGRISTLYMKEAFLRRRNLMLDAFKNIPLAKVNVPKGAFYLFPDMSVYFGKNYQNYTINNANDLCLFLLYEANVALVAGDSFGAPNCVRISYASADERLIEAMKRIESALKLLH
jgi:aspartate aminotransferase